MSSIPAAPETLAHPVSHHERMVADAERVKLTQRRDKIAGIVFALFMLTLEGLAIWGAIDMGGTKGWIIGGATIFISLSVTALTMYHFRVKPRAHLGDALLFLLGGPIIFALAMSKRSEIFMERRNHGSALYMPLLHPQLGTGRALGYEF